MVQITWQLPVGVNSTTTLKRNATTSGPMRIPHWAPDILFISTTTVYDQCSLLVPTTSSGQQMFAMNPNGGYNTRCFGVKQVNYENSFAIRNVVTLKYVAVGEVVRT